MSGALPFAVAPVPPEGATPAGDVAADEAIEVSLYLRRRDAAPDPAGTPDPQQRRLARHAQRAALHRDDIAQVAAFAAAHGLQVAAEPARRLVRLSGTAAQMQRAFGTTLARYRDAGGIFRVRTAPLFLPRELHAVVESVLGLDTRPVARPRHRRLLAPAQQAGLRPNEVAALYGFPAQARAGGVCIALIELGGGYLASDVAAAFGAMGLPVPAVTAVGVDGAANQPAPAGGADVEVALDIQIAGGAAPGAAICVYFAPNTEAGFADALSAASNDATHRPSVISISWGGPEPSWPAQARQTMDTLLQDAAEMNLSVLVAAGDSLATDGVADGKAHVDYPAASPWAIGCGGTAIRVAGGAIVEEVVWNDGTSGTGGGISTVYPVPAFQQSAGLPVNIDTGRPGRGVPDVAGDAAPGSGYAVVVNGQSGTVGGTSAVAPLWAGLIALVNAAAKQPAGFFLPRLYADPSLLRGITSGDNRPEGSSVGYAAGPGWNACTGLGVPRGQAIFAALTAPAPAA